MCFDTQTTDWQRQVTSAGLIRVRRLAALFGAVGSVVVGGIGTMVIAASWLKLFPSLAQRDRMEG